jgi:hypothetical protein
VTKVLFAPDSKNKLHTILLEFDEKYYEEVKEALIKKYGKTDVVFSTPLSNKITGNAPMFETVMWKSNGSSALLSNHNKDGSSYQDICSLFISSGSDSTQEKEEPADIYIKE